MSWGRSALRSRRARPFEGGRFDLETFRPTGKRVRPGTPLLSQLLRDRAEPRAISASDSHFWSFIATDSTKSGSFVVLVRGGSTRSAVANAPGAGRLLQYLFRFAASKGDTPRRQLLVVVPDVTARVASAGRANLAGHGHAHVEAAALRTNKAEFRHEHEECKPPAAIRRLAISACWTEDQLRPFTTGRNAQSAGSLDVVSGRRHGYAPGVSSL